MADGKKGGYSSSVTSQCVWMAEGWAREYEYLFGPYVVRKSPFASVSGGVASADFQSNSTVSQLDRFYQQLPDVFTNDDLATIFPEMNASTLRNNLSRLKKGGKLGKTAVGWQKA